MSNTITIGVDDIATVIASFDVVQVQRSAAGPPNYADALALTAAATTKPTIVGTLEGAFALLQGKTLKIKVDRGSEQVLLFAGANPIALTQVISEFTAGITGATAKNEGGGKLQIDGDNPGTDGHLQITGGTGISILGLTLNQADGGEDPYIPLQAGTSVYTYTDNGGVDGDYYRTRFYNTSSGLFSAWSDWMESSEAAVSSSKLILATVQLAEIDGTALVERKITIAPARSGTQVESYGIMGGALQLTTDSQGKAQTYLVMGALVDVIFDGTDLVRRILVPSTGSSFDLLDDSLVQHDPWEIQKKDIPTAIRRS